MTDADREMLERMLAEPAAPPRTVEAPTIHYTELPEDTSGGRGSTEWNFYRREVGRLLAEGHEGRWVLLKGEEVVGIWDTEAEARAAAVQRYLMQPVVIRQVLVRERVLRGPSFLFRWRA
jgi:hypothetical protein